MNSEMQKRLYEMEVTPPVAVWEKLSVTIDEINADEAITRKISNAELTPPPGVWDKINSTINPPEEKKPERKPIVVNLKRLAIAAIFIGLIATAWMLFQKNDPGKSTLAGTQDTTVKTNPANNTGSGDKKDVRIDQPGISNDLAPSNGSIALARSKEKALANNYYRRYRNNDRTRSTSIQYAALNRPLSKRFDQQIDDLSGVTSDQHYLTMVNANGRLVRIPAELAHLAPHLQDKPISEDIYEVMFGQGTYWKETLSEWRKKVASVPVTQGDAFTSFVELLKTIQDK